MTIPSTIKERRGNKEVPNACMMMISTYRNYNKRRLGNKKVPQEVVQKLPSVVLNGKKAYSVALKVV
jgi:hypothetical protein